MPGLHKHERRYGVSVRAVGGPPVPRSAASSPGSRSTKALEFLLGVGGTSLQPLIDANKYLTLVMLMFAAFGVAFEFPLLLVFLMLVGVREHPASCGKSRRWTAVGISVFAAVITPSAGSVLHIVHGHSHVPLLRDLDPDRAGDEAMSSQAHVPEVA